MSNLRVLTLLGRGYKKHNLSLDDFEEMVYATVISSKLAQYLFADKVKPFC